uniref:Uncharacterized protein n=1 Tax=viral metagenome TaxID=1070528 RepID=A0A6M3LUK4_9ZZZZ
MKITRKETPKEFVPVNILLENKQEYDLFKKVFQDILSAEVEKAYQKLHPDKINPGLPGLSPMGHFSNDVLGGLKALEKGEQS